MWSKCGDTSTNATTMTLQFIGQLYQRDPSITYHQSNLWFWKIKVFKLLSFSEVYEILHNLNPIIFTLNS